MKCLCVYIYQYHLTSSLGKNAVQKRNYLFLKALGRHNKCSTKKEKIKNYYKFLLDVYVRCTEYQLLFLWRLKVQPSFWYALSRKAPEEETNVFMLLLLLSCFYNKACDVLILVRCMFCMFALTWYGFDFARRLVFYVSNFLLPPTTYFRKGSFWPSIFDFIRNFTINWEEFGKTRVQNAEWWPDEHHNSAIGVSSSFTRGGQKRQRCFNFSLF